MPYLTIPTPGQSVIAFEKYEIDGVGETKTQVATPNF